MWTACEDYVEGEPMRSPVTTVSVPWLIANLTTSVDLWECQTHGSRYMNKCEPGTCSESARANWMHLLERKYEECSQRFIDTISTDFTHPVCVQVRDNGEWWFGNGNHRLAIAVFKNLPTMNVVFSFDNDYMHEDLTNPKGSDRSY